MDDAALLKTCLDLGAADARLMRVDDIPFDKTLRAYCIANSCGSYGRNYACPPGVGEPDALIAKARSFSRALLFQTVCELEDSFDIEGMPRAAHRHGEISNAIFAATAPAMARRLLLTVGGCNVCKACAQQTGEPCRFPDRALSSLEAYCMNVSRLCGKCSMKYINGANTVTYFGMCLFD